MNGAQKAGWDSSAVPVSISVSIDCHMASAVWEHKDRACPDANDRSTRRKQFKILVAVSRQFAWLWLGLFLDPQLFEACDEIIGQIDTISRDALSRRPHQVKARGRASVPLIDGYHPSPVSTAVQRLKSEVRKFWRAVDEIDHLENMRNDCSWRKNCDRQLLAQGGHHWRCSEAVSYRRRRRVSVCRGIARRPARSFSSCCARTSRSCGLAFLRTESARRCRSRSDPMPSLALRGPWPASSTGRLDPTDGADFRPRALPEDSARNRSRVRSRSSRSSGSTSDCADRCRGRRAFFLRQRSILPGRQ
jgi:hypothetical protein